MSAILNSYAYPPRFLAGDPAKFPRPPLNLLVNNLDNSYCQARDASSNNKLSKDVPTVRWTFRALKRYHQRETMDGLGIPLIERGLYLLFLDIIHV